MENQIFYFVLIVRNKIGAQFNLTRNLNIKETFDIRVFVEELVLCVSYQEEQIH